MIAFDVNDMSCGHCVSTLTQALKSVDPAARVQVDLARHRVQIEPAAAGAAELGDAIREAGYTPVLVADVAAVSPVPVATKGRCCCL